MQNFDSYRCGRNWINVGDTVKCKLRGKHPCLGRVLAIRGENDEATEIDVVLTTKIDGISRATMAGTTRVFRPDSIERVAQTRNGHDRFARP